MRLLIRMMEKYLTNPTEIEEKSFGIIRNEVDLSGFDRLQQQVVMRLVHTSGNLALAQQIRISNNAVQKGIDALTLNTPVLCDVEMVKQGLTKRFLNCEPLCFLNEKNVPERARQRGETRTMSALSHWEPHLRGAIALIGNAPTALFRLMEMLEAGVAKPALVIGMPVGFVGAAQSKRYLWQHYQDLGVECITIQGRAGGSALAAGTLNTIMRLKQGLFF